jgi:hypothetical protein
VAALYEQGRVRRAVSAGRVDVNVGRREAYARIADLLRLQRVSRGRGGEAQVVNGGPTWLGMNCLIVVGPRKLP